MADHFGLSENERIEVYETGKHNKFANRVFWALSYLNMSGLVKKPKRGLYQISEEGLKLLETPELIDAYVQAAIKERRKAASDAAGEVLRESSDEDLTPEEQILDSIERIKQSAYVEIIDLILKKKPLEFEKLVVQLMQKMGYGGELEDSGFVTQFANDGGIDGIIKEDVLGLGRIHIRAKRYKPGLNVGREDIQKFVGALAVAQSNKGVFITTSKFTSGAKEYVKSLNATTTIVLINGEQLAKHIYEYGLGMQTEQVFEIKKLDSDFWDSMIDE